MYCIDQTKIGLDFPPYIIAELSGNHNGSLDRAIETITEAKRRGASAVKLQTYTAESMTLDCNEVDFIVRGGLWNGFKLYDLYRWAQTPYDWHPKLFAHAKKIGVTIFSSPFDEAAVDFLQSLDASAFKIASPEIVDLKLIKRAASTGRPLIISTGMSSEAEIQEAIVTAKGAGCSKLALLHCVTSYPAPLEQSNLRQIPELARHFDVDIIGLSDHTKGTAAAVAAVALGARIIEKHFTLNRSDGGPDSDFSLEPAEFEILCRDARDAWVALGKSGFDRPESESLNRPYRRSLYFVKNLEAGQVIKQGDVRSIRPGLGISPKYIDLINGKIVKQDVKPGTALNWSMLE
jgi:N-acetylneuraminate synthase